MIDIHIGYSRDEVHEVKKHPMVTYHAIQATQGHIGETRYQGYSRGNHDFCAMVDPDDDYDLDVIIGMVTWLEDHPHVAALASEEAVNGVESDDKYPGHLDRHEFGQVLNIHHIVVYRRSALNKYVEVLRDHSNLPEFVLNGAMIEAGEVLLHWGEVGYHWNASKDGARHKIPVSDKTREATDRLVEAARERNRKIRGERNA